MNLSIYCRDNNIVTPHGFFKDLKTKNLIFIGEDHFSKIHEKNEETILKELSKTKKFNLATEDISHSRYQSKREMIAQFVPQGLLYLPIQDDQTMAQAIREIISEETPTIVIVGSRHLKNSFSLDTLVRKNHPNISSTVVIQKNNASSSIYKIKTPFHQDYLLVGNLLEIS